MVESAVSYTRSSVHSSGTDFIAPYRTLDSPSRGTISVRRSPLLDIRLLPLLQLHYAPQNLRLELLHAKV
jgi:hypothetical protein